MTTEVNINPLLFVRFALHNLHMNETNSLQKDKLNEIESGLEGQKANIKLVWECTVCQ